ncbi:MAG TPA: hypothetical protein VN113_01405 [Caulobacter sp.]|nr:hypothetical protein [Caulobacter sp.]
MSSSEPQDAAPALGLVANTEHDLGLHHLAIDELRALRQLERRIRTGRLDAVNIRDAQRLAELGLAHHGRGGWRPTEEGLAYLGDQDGVQLGDESA